MTTPVNNISLLDDLPNAVGGLSAAELKARFDKAGGDIQTFLNETLIPALEQMGVDEGTARDEAIQAAIDALELDTTVENLQKAIVAAESRSKEYADTKDAANLAAAKQYADTKAATARAAAENTAARDAASKADAALSNAKSYTDDKAAAVLAEAALGSGSDAQNAETAAKRYADTQDAATLTAAKEYTDGKIPSKLPNPQKLKFTGAVSAEYDGSEEKTINIPSGGSADLPPVLGNFNAAMQDAAAGSIPVYAGDEAWEIEKLIMEYNENTPLSGYIPDTAWVAAYMAAQKELLKLLPDSAAADAGKLLQVGADGKAKWGDKLPTALKNPKVLTFAGAVTGTYDGSEALTITIPEGGSGGSSGGGLRKMSAVASYIDIPAAELPQDGTVWMCISKGDGAELYSGTVTIEGGSLTANNLIAVSSGSVIQLNQATTIGAGFVIYGMSATDYVGVWQEVGAGGASINWRGEYSAQTAYNRLDAVSYEGSSYVFASDTPATGAIPGVDGEWQLMAQKGDSGTDLSLGVTGATVGQIAKITAVDTNGRPTAWAPVDMPSGGGKLIETKHTAICDGETTVYAFPMEAETIIGIQIIGTKADMVARGVSIALRFNTGETYRFAQWTLNGSQFTPKNVAWILGNDKIRNMLTNTAEYAMYTSTLQGFVMQGYSQTDVNLADTIVDKIALTFDSPPVSGAKIKIVGG